MGVFVHETTSTSNLTPHSRAALHHLTRLSPLDGYAIDSYLSTTNEYLLRLKRRNVPLHDQGFVDIVISDGEVVGIQVLTGKGDVGRGVVLVKRDGTVCNVDRAEEVTVNVRMEDVKSESISDEASAAAAAAMAGLRSTNMRSTTIHRVSRTNSNPDAFTSLSEADNQLLIQYGVLFLVALMLFKIMLSSLQSLSILLLPVAYVYALQTCPLVESFDAKKEIKRVLRGAHLPQDAQGNFFERGINRIAASIGTELATGLGYEVSVDDYFGALKLAWVRVPVAGMDFYWCGIFGKLIQGYEMKF
jgi:hypothetical protein